MDWVKGNWMLLSTIFIAGLAWGEGKMDLHELRTNHPGLAPIAQQQAVLVNELKHQVETNRRYEKALSENNQLLIQLLQRLPK